MKLWLKISLIAIIMVTLATGICSLIMLLRSGRSNLDLAVDAVLTDQQMRGAAWSSAMESEIDNGYSAVAQRSLARYLIDKFANENTILISDDDVIYNATNIDPLGHLAVSGQNQQYIIQDIGGSTILIVGSSLSIRDTPYILYVIMDISAVYTGIAALSYQFALINLGVILCAGVIIIVLVRLILRPVASLKENAGLIAAGIYDKRIETTQQDEIGELAAHFNSIGGSGGKPCAGAAGRGGPPDDVYVGADP